MVSGRRAGRPPKPPTEHYFVALPDYAYIAAWVAADYVNKWRRRFKRSPEFWRNIRETLFEEAILQMCMLSRRYDGRGTPGGFLGKYLPQHCKEQFDKILAFELGLGPEIPFSSLDQTDEEGNVVPFDWDVDDEVRVIL